MNITVDWTIDLPSPNRLLLVEDSKHDMLAIKRTLRKDAKEWDVKYADSVTNALKELEAEPYIDIVLTDYNLNGPNGLDLCEIILTSHQDVTVILLTGTGSEAIAADALRLGVGDYLIKDPTGGYLDLLSEALLNAWRRQNERRLLQERLHQSQRMEAMGQLTGGVAHDFNNMLAIMIGNIELLEQEIPTIPAARKRIDNLKEIIDRAASLTQRLLAFSSQQPLSPQTTDIVLLLGDLKDMLAGTLGEAINLTIIANDDLWETHIDGSQLDHVLINLALNARDAMSDGGSLTIKTTNVTVKEAFTTQLGEVPAGDYVQISVSDSGIGMKPDILKKIFEPFFTTKGVGEGSGLGLSMVYGFVKQSGGHIVAESKPGQGTTITIYLPRSHKPTVVKSADTTRSELPIKKPSYWSLRMNLACEKLPPRFYAVKDSR